MIQANEPIETKAQLTPEDMFKVTYILMRIVGGMISIPKEKLDTLPADAQIKIAYDEKSKQWVFRAPIPKSLRERGIVTPRRKIIT